MTKSTRQAKKDVFTVLSNIDVSGWTKSFPAGNKALSYLSWTQAWRVVKQYYPKASFKKHTFTDFQNNTLPFMRDINGQTFVMTSVTIEDETHTEVYPVWVFGKAKVNPDSLEINKALQRCLTKTLAYFGLGLSVYHGEDFPEVDAEGIDDQMHTICDAFKASKNIHELKLAYGTHREVLNKLPKSPKETCQQTYRNKLLGFKAKEKEAA